jgi:hypothetical protein
MGESERMKEQDAVNALSVSSAADRGLSGSAESSIAIRLSRSSCVSASSFSSSATFSSVFSAPLSCFVPFFPSLSSTSTWLPAASPLLWLMKAAMISFMNSFLPVRSALNSASSCCRIFLLVTTFRSALDRIESRRLRRLESDGGEGGEDVAEEDEAEDEDDARPEGAEREDGEEEEEGGTAGAGDDDVVLCGWEAGVMEAASAASVAAPTLLASGCSGGGGCGAAASTGDMAVAVDPSTPVEAGEGESAIAKRVTNRRESTAMDD